jgi:putative ABC transport system permease protein
MNSLQQWFLGYTSDWRNLAGVAVLAVVILVAILYWGQTRFVLKSLRRNLLRSVLTGLATFMLVMLVTLIWSILALLDGVTQEKSKNLKAIITEKYQIPSQMPYSYKNFLEDGAPRTKEDYRVDPDKDSMYWAFYGGTLDPAKMTRENIVFFFAMDPRKLIAKDSKGKFTSMMDDLDDVSDADKERLVKACEEMVKFPSKVVVGPARLKALNKRVGEKMKVTSLNYKGIDLEFEIMDVLPGGRYEQSAVMNYDYLDKALESYKRENKSDHPMAQKTMALMWLRVPDTDKFDKVAKQVETSPLVTSPKVKCETASSGIASFLDAYKDLLWIMRVPLVFAILATMSLVIANAISISVRERRTEMAVLKVLGFTPNQILILVLSEALLVGCGSGVLGACATWFLINKVVGGIAFPIAFFGKFFIDGAAPWWGLGIGALTAFIGSVIPAWSARSVRVSEVFSKVA